MSDEIEQNPNNGNDAPPEAPQLPPGVETRIAELTKQFGDERRNYESKIDELSRQQAETLRLFAERLPANPVPDPYALRPDEDPMDPAMERQMRRLFGPQFARLQATIEQQQAYIQNLGFKAHEAQEPPEVIELAKKFMATWRREGKSGWVEADAIDFAWAKLHRQDSQTKVTESQNRFGRPVQGPQDEMLRYHGAPPSSAPQSHKRIPSNIDALPLEQRLKAYIDAGIGDEPL